MDYQIIKVRNNNPYQGVIHYVSEVDTWYSQEDALRSEMMKELSVGYDVIAITTSSNPQVGELYYHKDYGVGTLIAGNRSRIYMQNGYDQHDIDPNKLFKVVMSSNPEHGFKTAFTKRFINQYIEKNTYIQIVTLSEVIEDINPPLPEVGWMKCNNYTIYRTGLEEGYGFDGERWVHEDKFSFVERPEEWSICSGGDVLAKMIEYGEKLGLVDDDASNFKLSGEYFSWGDSQLMKKGVWSESLKYRVGDTLEINFGNIRVDHYIVIQDVGYVRILHIGTHRLREAKFDKESLNLNDLKEAFNYANLKVVQVS